MVRYSEDPAVQVEAHISAPPAVVWPLASDITLPARFSTELVAAENVAVAGLARKLGACLAGRGPGTVEYEVALVPAEYSLDWWSGCVDGLAQPVREG